MNPSQTYPSQTYAQQAYPSSTGGGQTTTHTTTTSRTIVSIRPYFDMEYLRTLPGILKCVQLVLMLIAFIIAAAAWSSSVWGPLPNGSYYASSSAGWAKFVTITGFIITLILLSLYIFHLIEKFYQINWLLTEFVYCGVWAVLLFIAGCVMIPYADYDGARGAVVFFCWAAGIAYGVDAFFKLKSHRNGEVAQGVRASQSTVTTATSYPPPYPKA